MELFKQWESTVATGGNFRAPAVAVRDGLIAVAADTLDMKSVSLYVSGPDGTWRGGLAARAGHGTALQPDCTRVYVPSVCIPAVEPGGKPWAIATARLGTKEGGTMQGQGVFMINPAGLINARFLKVTTGTARIAADPDFPGDAVVLSKDGVFFKVAADVPGYFGKGKLDIGSTGEKLAFCFTRPNSGTGPAIMHAAMNGCARQASAYNNTIRAKSGLKPLNWAAYAAYSFQGNDFCYNGICPLPGRPRKAILGACFWPDKPGLSVNVFNGGKGMRFNPSALPVAAPDAIFQARHVPAMFNAAGLALCAFRDRAGVIALTDLETGLAGARSRIDMQSGAYAAAADDGNGGFVLAWTVGGKLKAAGYKITV